MNTNPEISLANQTEPKANQQLTQSGLKNTDLMPLDTFLHHYYQVLLRYISSNEELSKVFNLYVIQTKKTKSEVDIFRQSYVNSLSQYSNVDLEVAYFLNLLKKNDKAAIDFIIKGKRKILLFYEIGESNLGFPLSEVRIKISEWINLLKSFSFFGSDDLSKKIESFKQFIIDENENFVQLNAMEFLKAVYKFYMNMLDEELRQVQSTRFTTSKMTFKDNKEERNFAMPLNSSDYRGLNIGKVSQKFKEKTPVILPVKSGQQNQRRINKF